MSCRPTTRWMFPGDRETHNSGQAVEGHGSRLLLGAGRVQADGERYPQRRASHGQRSEALPAVRAAVSRQTGQERSLSNRPTARNRRHRTQRQDKGV